MKKFLSLFLAVILIISAAIPATAMSTERYVQLVHIQEGEIDVQTAMDYSSLEQAVADAKNGDIIEVFDNVTVSAPVTVPADIELTVVSGTLRTYGAIFGRDIFVATDVNAVKRTVKKNFSGSLFTLSANSKVTFENIILDGNGKSAQKGGLIYCKSGASLTLKRGVTLKNSALGTGSYGGAVYAEKNALVSVENTEFSGNIATYGKDIYAELKEDLSLLPGVSAYTSYGSCKTHIPQTTLKKATLTGNGKSVTACAVCGAVIKSTTIYYPETVTISATKYTYTGKAIKPAVTVKDSAGNAVSAGNYTVTYSNNINVGTATVTVAFKGNYSGTKKLTFTVIPQQVTGLKVTAVSKASVKLSWSASGGAKYYKLQQSTDGKQWTNVAVTDKTAYSVTNLTAAKKYQYRVTPYDGTKKIAGKTSSVLSTFTCKTHTKKTAVSAKATLSANGKAVTTCSACGVALSSSVIYYPKTFTLSATSVAYTGKALKPALTVKDSAGKVISASYYSLSYANNVKIGTGTVTVTFKGNYSGKKTLSFKIVPAQVTGLKVTAVSKTAFKLAWSKAAGAKYYKLQQSTDGKNWKSLVVTDATLYTVSGLKTGGKYQFRVIAYDSTKKVAGKTSAVLKTGTLTASPVLTLKSAKSKTATASWQKVAGASKYAVYKSTDNKNWTKAATVTSLSYNLTKLSGGKKIYVKVTAVNAYGKASAASTVKSVTVKK